MKYLQLVKKHGWKLFLPEDPPSQGQSQAASEPSTLQVQLDNLEFNEEVFHQHLLNFIIADDQVCSHFLSLYIYYAYVFLVPNPKALHVIECPEFHQLLVLLRGGIESLIPCRTKLHKLVLQAWKWYFQTLHNDLNVCLITSFPNTYHS